MEKLYIVDESNPTILFTKKSLQRLAKMECRIIYAILAKNPDAGIDSCVTIGIALTPKQALEMCEVSMADLVEIWVIENDGSIASEKWEPKYFMMHFSQLVETHEKSIKQQEEANAEKSQEEGENTDYMTDVLPSPESISMNDILRYLFITIDKIRNLTTGASYSFGHPMPLKELLDDMNGSIGRIIYSFLYTTGNHQPRYRTVSGEKIPYWTKQQIESAKIE